MEYEKKYNDLIARINEVKEKPRLCMKDKHHYNGYVETGIRDALDYIVSPESEDERIRKEIIDWMKGGTSYDWQENKERWIAYLEKQKEQKPVDVSEKIEELCSKYPLNKRGVSEQELSAYHQGLTFGATKIAEYLGAQKPADWSEEDDALLKEIVSFFKDGTVKLQHDLDLYAGFLEKKFKSLRPQPHWKPSDEQMEALKDAFRKDGGNEYRKVINSLYRDLEKLL